MTSKALRRRQKKANQSAAAQSDTYAPQKQQVAYVPRADDDPTREQQSRPGWLKPEKGKPWVRLDLIGLLHQRGQITDAEEQAARIYQQLRMEYLAELQTRGFGSCLADNMAGHKSDEGRAGIIREYRYIEQKVGYSAISHLAGEVFKTSDEKPHLIGLTKEALRRIAEL